MALNILKLFCCPYCHDELSDLKGNLYCQKCNKTFPIKDGIPSFINQTDEFYEGRFTSTHRVFTNPLLKFLYDVYTLVSIDTGRERFIKVIRKELNLNKKKPLILDLACGGGWHLLSQLGDVVGVDVSFQSLQNAKKIYRLAVHSDAYNLPFNDNSFDLVCSFDFIGHIPPQNKEKFLSEIYRVTKEGGYTTHSAECDSQGALYRWARRYPDLYQKYFVNMYGHCGLELPTKVFERFRRAGFIPIIEKADPCKTNIRPIGSYRVFFDNEFKTKSLWIRMLVTVCKPFQHPILGLIANFLLGFFVPINDLLTPVNNRDSVKVLYQKEKSLVVASFNYQDQVCHAHHPISLP